MNKIRLIIADDERPAREFLKNILREFEDAEVVGEASDGLEALEIIKREKPDLALLDLQMPEITGLEAVKLLRKNQMPLIAFITAYDDFAVQAFEIGAVDYLLKPVEKSRLRETLNRAHERLEKSDWRENQIAQLKTATKIYDESLPPKTLERIPVKIREEIRIIPVSDISSITADGELLQITTANLQKYFINYRLKDLEARLDQSDFVRLSRGSIVNLNLIKKISPMPGGIYQITLKNGEELSSSRLQSKVLREKILKI